jgi:hypothetical protein
MTVPVYSLCTANAKGQMTQAAPSAGMSAKMPARTDAAQRDQ